MATISGELTTEQVKLRRRKKGIRLCILVSETNSCRSAYRFLKAFLIPSLDELHLVTAVNSELGRASALTRQRELLEVEAMDCSHHHVVVKEEEYSLFESLGRYISSIVRPHLILMGSTTLCTSHMPGGNGSSISRSSAAAPRQAPSSPSASQQLRRMSSLGRAGGAGASSSPAAPSLAPSGTSTGAGASLGNGMGTLGSSCLALRVLPELRCAPVLLAKFNTKGPWLSAMASLSSLSSVPASFQRMPSISPTLFQSSSMSRPASAAVSRSVSMRGTGASGGGAGGSSGGSSMGWPMRVMVDLQPNSRHVLDWLFENFTPGHDHLFLTVSQAFDGQHNVKPAAQRLLTAFGVQAAVNSFEADKSVLAGPANKSLPQAVAEAEPDVLVLQTPRCRGLPPAIVEVLYSAKTSFLIWPPDYIPPQ